MMKRSISCSLLMFTAASVTACGDALVTADDRGDVVFGVHGNASSRTLCCDDEYEVGVLFVRVLIRSATLPDSKDQLETEVVKTRIAGRFPARFHVELTRPPTVYPYDHNIIYGNFDGTQSDGVFFSGNAPDGVRIGQLAIGPARELAALPARIEFSLFEQRTIGGVLAPYLPNTTITSYQVIYAEGVHEGDVIYPTYTGTGITGGTPIYDGFTLVDARTYFTSILWQECAFNAAPSEIDATCGPERTPHPDQLRILSELEPLSVVLGGDDIKAGMWMLHASRQ